MRYCMPQEGYGSVSAPEEKIEQASDYKPDGATWGEVLVAGAERLNDALDSDMGRRMTADGGVDDDLREQLDRIEEAAKEATNAAQSAERAAEELQR